MSQLPPNLPTRQPSAMTVPQFMAAKAKGQKLVVLTAYDYSMARLLDEAGVDCILVGDSVGMVAQGHPHCLPVTLGEMIYHTRCVARGVKNALLVADLPFMTFQVSPRQTIRNAGRLLKQGNAQAVKLEGGVRSAETIAALVRADIPVMGHVGMTPQSVHQFGGFKVQRQEDQILADAMAVEQSGAFALVLECIPETLAARITAKLKIPTIGIGAGKGCDGQVLVLHDMLGLLRDFQPRFVKRFAELGTTVLHAVEAYAKEVRDGTFPAPEHAFQ